MTQKITPYLWFDGNAEEAMNFYLSVFKNSKAGEISRWGEGGMGAPGSVIVANFEIEGQKFAALNGGPEFNFTEAISFQIDCKDQEEVDYYWNALTADGGEESVCGWLKDKFGVSWQVVPSILGELMTDPNPAKASAATQAMLQMRKIEIDKLKEAHANA
jgi:predicted 3-demethylubiquinone-9 3-methyltransferase (glyoxalase superfamily)